MQDRPEGACHAETRLILSDSLPPGLAANFAAVLGMSIGRLRTDLPGPDTPAADGAALAGIITVPLPVLCAPEAALPGLFAAAGELPLRRTYTRAAFEARDSAGCRWRPEPGAAPGWAGGHRGASTRHGAASGAVGGLDAGRGLPVPRQRAA